MSNSLYRNRRCAGFLLAAALITGGVLYASAPLGAQPSDPSWVTTSLPDGQVGEPYTADLVILPTESTTGCIVSSTLPDGLTFTPAVPPSLPLPTGEYVCGTISGVPTTYEVRTVSAYITLQLQNGEVENWQLFVDQAPQPTTTRPAPTTTTTSGSESGAAVARPTFTG
jgi:hypothetical protein